MLIVIDSSSFLFQQVNQFQDAILLGTAFGYILHIS